MPSRMKLWLRATTSALALALATQANAALVFSSPGQTDLAFVAGTYEIIVSGAQGGTAPGGDYGGNGATVLGTFHLASPGTFRIIVGGQGGYGGRYLNSFTGGGGGGSFVFLTGSNTPLAIAGGGGGGSLYGPPGGHGQAGAGTGPSGRGGAAGGGTYDFNPDGAGGGGFTQGGADGQGHYIYSGASGGQAATGGAGGGTGGSGSAFGGDGGFGGGGGGGGAGASVYYSYTSPGYTYVDPITGEETYYSGQTYSGTNQYGGYGGGGGGGGFRGGAGGRPGYAGQGGYSYLGNVLPGTGRSYNGGDFITRFQSILGYGNGFVSIDLLSTDQTGVPEPASMGLFGLSLAGLALARRRRRR